MPTIIKYLLPEVEEMGMEYTCGFEGSNRRDSLDRSHSENEILVQCFKLNNGYCVCKSDKINHISPSTSYFVWTPK